MPVFASPARDWLFAAMADADPGKNLTLPDAFGAPASHGMSDEHD
jgi:hypothetical protein